MAHTQIDIEETHTSSASTHEERERKTQEEKGAHTTPGSFARTLKHPPHLVMSGLYLAAFLGMLSETSMNIAVPAFMSDFGIGTGLAQWMIIGYMLAIGVVLPFVGFFQKNTSTKHVALGALTAFLLGSLISTLAPSFAILLAGRILQGVGTGIILPVLFSSIIHIFPPTKIGAANGVAGLVIMVAPVIGPTMSGLMISSLGWRAIFATFSVVALVALLLVVLFYVNPIVPTGAKIDILSALSSVVGFGSLVGGAGLLGEQGLSPLALGLIFLGVLVLASYCHRQLTISRPIVDLRVLSLRGFRYSAIAVALSFTCTLTCMYIVPIELQRGLGLDSSLAGILMLPAGIVNAIFSLFAGRLFDKVGARPLIALGGCTALVGIGLFGLVGEGSPLGFFVLAHVVLLIGIPFIQQAAQSAALVSLPRRYASDGSTILNTLQQVCAAIGTAVATCLLSVGVSMAGGGESAPAGQVLGARYVFACAAFLILVALLVGLCGLTKSANESLVAEQA